jgi:protoporphyrinogen/coproporphyrinogen III oxidase
VRVTVVGGGITGLAAAFELAGAGASVTVLEADDRLGGKILTTDLDGRPVDCGPDMFLARVPWGLELVGELGLTGELIQPATGAAWVWARGRARRLPEGMVLGVPTSVAAVARSGILGPGAVARAGLDLVRPRYRYRAGQSWGAPGPTVPWSQDPDDIAVGAVVRHRFGRAVNERLVDPLLGGINAGQTDRLSLAASAPQLVEVFTKHRSLLRGLRAQRAANPPDPTAPVFHSLAGGMQRLVDVLVDRLRAGGVELRTGAAVDSVPDGPVVLAVPAHAAARLVPDDIAPLFARIAHASVAVLAIDLPDSAIPEPLAGSGLLVPRPEGRLTTAVTMASTKWPSIAVPGRTTLRVSAGRIGDDRAMQLDDAQLLVEIARELRELLGVRADPVAVRISRWPQSFPQYEPGHLGRVAHLEQVVAAWRPDIALAGAAYRGVGIPACIRQGREAARRLLAPST